MNNYQATSVVTLFAGKVALNADQVRRRLHQIKPVDGNVYEILKPIQFKVGETFGFEGDIPKSVVRQVEGVAAVEASVSVKAERPKRLKPVMKTVKKAE